MPGAAVHHSWLQRDHPWKSHGALVACLSVIVPVHVGCTNAENFPGQLRSGQMDADGAWEEFIVADGRRALELAIGADWTIWVATTRPAFPRHVDYQVVRHEGLVGLWNEVDAGAFRLAGRPDGNVIVVQSHMLAYDQNPGGHPPWQLLPRSCSDIAVGRDGSIWSITRDAGIPGGMKVVGYSKSGNDWQVQELPERGGVRVAVDQRGQPWALGVEGTIHAWSGQAWHDMEFPSRALELAIGGEGASEKLWVLAREDRAIEAEAQLYELSSPTDDLASPQWRPHEGGQSRGVEVAVDPTGHPWLVQTDGRVWRWVNHDR